MEFDLIDMEVKNLQLLKDIGEEAKKPKYQLKLESTMDYNQADQKSVRLNVHTTMTADNSFKLELDQIFYFKFKTEISGEDAQRIITESKTEALIFPYVRTYITNLLTMSGFPSVHIPFILVTK